MGCNISRPGKEEQAGEEEAKGVVNLCRDRKRLMKSAVEARFSLAGAHSKYYESLYAVALAIRLFVSRHSSVSSPLLITFPSTNQSLDDTISTTPFVPNSLYCQHTPSLPITHQDSSVPSRHSSKIETENQEKEMEGDEEEKGVCEHFYDSPIPMQNDQFGWDYFNLFDGGVMEQKSFNVSGDFSAENVDAVGAVSEIQGNQEAEKKIEDVKDMGDGVMGLKEVDTSTDGRELLDALKDVEQHFIKAYESGFEVSKMLETHMVQLHPALEDIEEKSNKLVRSFTWNRSRLSRTPSSKSFLSCSSRSTFMWTESSIDILDEYGTGGMESGSHSSTLGRLYAWEKKLYDEVKTGDELRKIYERKCSQLSNKKCKEDGHCSEDKTIAEMGDLYSGISVTITRADSISKRIQKLRDEELQPQVVELLRGLMKTWKTMLEVHQSQNQTMSEVQSFSCPTLRKFSNDSHRLATLQLEAALQNWQSCFAEYFSATKEYIEALSGWLSKSTSPENKSNYKDIASSPPCQINGPQLLAICRDWLASMNKLPYELVEYAIKSFGKDIRSLWFQQGVEQQQKRKLDGLSREREKRVLAFQKAEKKILETRLCEQKVEIDVQRRIEYLEGKRHLLDTFNNKFDIEEAKHHESIQDMQKVMLIGFQTGLSSVFDSLEVFSKVSLKMYTQLLSHEQLLC